MKSRDRAEAIEKWPKILEHEKEEKIKAWGLEVSKASHHLMPTTHGFQINTKMLKLDARVLPPPEVLYKQGRTMVRDGSWNMRHNQVKPLPVISSNAVHLNRLIAGVS